MVAISAIEILKADKWLLRGGPVDPINIQIASGSKHNSLYMHESFRPYSSVHDVSRQFVYWVHAC